MYHDMYMMHISTLYAYYDNDSTTITITIAYNATANTPTVLSACYFVVLELELGLEVFCCWTTKASLKL